MIAPWLEQYWQQSVQALHNGRLAHANLLSGCAGLGKLNFAIQLAKKILCVEHARVACNHCQSCQWFAANSHPDYRVLTLEEEKKQISITQIRHLTEVLSRTGYGRYQVVIIHPAEAMNRAAANALLKTLEEPSRDVILLLVSDRPTGLLPTIRSRCQELRVHLPTHEVVLPWLEAELVLLDAQAPPPPKGKGRATVVNTERPSAAELLALADGLPLRALRLAQSGEWLQYEQVSADFVQVLMGKMSALRAAEGWAKQSAPQVLSIIMTLVQDMVRLSSGLKPEQIQHGHRAAALQQLAQRYTLDQLWHFSSDLQQAKRRALSNANPNVQLLLESVFIRFLSGSRTTS